MQMVDTIKYISRFDWYFQQNQRLNIKNMPYTTYTN
jgi:hypothetical protein